MEGSLDEALEKRIKKIKLLLLDVDGVMTGGSIIYDDDGREIKVFDVRDGHGLKLLMRAGIGVGIITSRTSGVVAKRAEDLGIELLYQGRIDKLKAFGEVLERKALAADEVAFMGDDIVDLPVLKRAGFSVAVHDAVDEVRGRVHYVTSNPGGRGAVREVSELILKVQGKWEGLMERYLR
ncbi:MAG: KdsC family phosphatase [Thermodesulfobacteriota bacterium]